MTGRSDIGDEVLAALRRIIRSIELRSRRLAQQHGLTGPQLVLLQQAARLGKVTVGQLAREVSLSPGTVTDILDRLESRDLIKRTRDAEDRRRVLIQPTRQAKAILRRAPALLQERFTRQLAELADWEQTLLLSSLQRLASMMDDSTEAPTARPPDEVVPPPISRM